MPKSGIFLEIILLSFLVHCIKGRVHINQQLFQQMSPSLKQIVLEKVAFDNEQALADTEVPKESRKRGTVAQIWQLRRPLEIDAIALNGSLYKYQPEISYIMR